MLFRHLVAVAFPKIKVYRTVAILWLFSSVFCWQLIICNPALGITEPTLTLSLSPIEPINLKPGGFGSVTQNISVTTDNYTGYSVVLSNPVQSTDLINTMDNTLIIPTITLPDNVESITVNEFTSGYGFSTDGEHYVPAPIPAEDLLIGSSNATGEGSHNLTFGVKLPEDIESGSYAKSFIIAAVVNNPQYSITYEENANDELVTDMPTDQSVTVSSDGIATLSNNTPTRTNYTFMGWDEDGTTTSSPTYAPGDTIELEPTQANAIVLYAIWESTPEPIIADYTEEFIDTGGSTASATTALPNLSPADYVTKIFAYTNDTGRTISSISVEIVYSKTNQGSTSGSLIGKLNVNGTEYSASPVSVARNKATNAHLSLAQFDNLNIPSSNNITFTIGTESDAFVAGITISSQTVTVTFAD